MPEEAIKPRRITRLREIEQRILAAPKKLVKIEKKLVDFPFSRYFIGHPKSQTPKYKPNWREWENDRITMAWLGHSTILINFFGTWIITDPVFSERVGIDVGVTTIGPRRMMECPLKPEELPPLDLILVSHAHMDHTDIPSLKKLRAAKHVVIAANTSGVYKPIKFRDVRELDWGQSITFADLGGLRVEGIEVRHAGWRFPWHPCRSRKELHGYSYNAYLVEKIDSNGNSRSFVFGGDTGYIKTFRALGERMRNEDREIDVALMPIGAYNPWVEAHCNPGQAWQMTVEMNARQIFPMHWNTYIQSSEPYEEPIEWLRAVVDTPEDIAVSDHGETWSIR